MQINFKKNKVLLDKICFYSPTKATKTARKSNCIFKAMSVVVILSTNGALLSSLVACKLVFFQRLRDFYSQLVDGKSILHASSFFLLSWILYYRHTYVYSNQTNVLPLQFCIRSLDNAIFVCRCIGSWLYLLSVHSLDSVSNDHHRNHQSSLS